MDGRHAAVHLSVSVCVCVFTSVVFQGEENVGGLTGLLKAAGVDEGPEDKVCLVRNVPSAPNTRYGLITVCEKKKQKEGGSS